MLVERGNPFQGQYMRVWVDGCADIVWETGVPKQGQLRTCRNGGQKINVQLCAKGGSGDDGPAEVSERRWEA